MNYPETVYPEVVIPSETVPVSVTGTRCSLNCKHCGGHYLKGMKRLSQLTGNERSILISGGCNSEGEVPFLNYRNKIEELKKKSKIVLHSGFLKEEKTHFLDKLADKVSFDFIGSEKTIRNVYGLNLGVDDFLNSFCAIAKKVDAVPHLTIGLEGGKVNGEKRAVELLSSIGVKRIVFNIFIPTPGTCFESRAPPDTKEVLKLLSLARGKFNELMLGCMRPGGPYRNRLDFEAINLVDRIVTPSPQVLKLKGIGGSKVFRECCIL
jgi:hypothetical protein